MANWTNESFLEEMEKEYGKDFDWDSVPDPETLPDVYTIFGIYDDGRCFGIDKEYVTLVEAETQVEKMKIDPIWQEHNPKIEIRKTKPSDAVWAAIYKECLRDIKKGDKVFPMYLP